MKKYPELYHGLNSLLKDLHKEIPAVNTARRAFNDLFEDGEISKKTKELMALAISISTKCHECIAYHTHNAMMLGATKKEIAETIGVSVAMSGGPGFFTGSEAFAASKQFVDDAGDYIESLYE